MLRTMFALVVAGLLVTAVSATSRAAPAAPLPAGVTAAGNLTKVYYHHRWHCWIGRYGRRHCGW